MRRKISSVQLVKAGADLPDLTENQHAFVRGILEGKTGADAYRAAYNCENMSDRTIIAEGSRLRNNHDIAAWIAAGREAHLGTGVVTLDNHIKELERLKEIAIKTGNVGAAVQAEQLRGKAQGHYVERLEVTAADPLDTLRQIATVSPDLARQLAQAQDIPWPEQRLTEH